MKKQMSMMKGSVILALLLGCGSCLAWGLNGHRTIGAVADRLLENTPAQKKLATLLLPAENLSSVAPWADCVKHPKICGQTALTDEQARFEANNHDNAEYHYTDLPFDAGHYVDKAVGSNEIDVVHIVQQCIAVLGGNQNPDSNPHHFSQREALLLLVHLVGDLHQPLHVGTVYLTQDGVVQTPTAAQLKALGTVGGNSLFINGKEGNLHAYWDSNVVEAAMHASKTTTPQALADALLKGKPRPTPLKGDLAPQVLAWADESLDAAEIAYHGVGYSAHREFVHGKYTEKGWAVTLPANYAQVTNDIARERLLLAGKRLAALLQLLLK